jgi:hypothetical protein
VRRADPDGAEDQRRENEADAGRQQDDRHASDGDRRAGHRSPMIPATCAVTMRAAFASLRLDPGAIIGTSALTFGTNAAVATPATRDRPSSSGGPSKPTAARTNIVV